MALAFLALIRYDFETLGPHPLILEHQYTHESHMHLFARLAHSLRRFLRNWLGYEAPLSHYVSHRAGSQLATGYMLLEDVRSQKSEMLSRTWHVKRHDMERRKGLFQGISRIILSLTHVPLPRIGSFSFNEDGTVTLSNRPQSASMMILEKEGSPRIIERNTAYQCTEPFVSDLLRFHDQRFLSYSNVIESADDCRRNTASSLLMRAVAHDYVHPTQRDGPFFLQLDDLHASNMFREEEWKVTPPMDLEWASSRPSAMLAVPYWLTGCSVDQLRDEKLRQFEEMQDEFWEVFEREEDKCDGGNSLLDMMRQTWASGAVWFWQILVSTNGKVPLLRDHICPTYSSKLTAEEETPLSKFWSWDADRVAEEKVKQFQEYTRMLQDLFASQAVAQ